MSRWIKISGFIFIALLLSACQQKESTKTHAFHTITAKLTPSDTKLYFSGQIKPLSNQVVIAPTDGIIKKVQFKYGEPIKKGQILAIDEATDLDDKYRQMLTAYLKEKNTFLQGEKKFAGNQALWKLGIISENDFNSDKAEQESNELSLINSEHDLRKALLGNKNLFNQIKNLSLSNLNEVREVLAKNQTTLPIISDQSGLALLPPNSSGTNTNNDSNGCTKISAGCNVKKGQVITAIGNLSGLTVKINIPETYINRIHIGLPVEITGPGFPDITLKGNVDSVAFEANNDHANGSTSTFPVTIKIPTITPEQSKVVHIDMSAKAQILLKNKPQIMIPITAVHLNGGHSQVFIIDPKTKQQRSVPVTTGQTTTDQVAITTGIKPGDQVVVPNLTNHDSPTT